jgi:hypothetical protein
MDSKGKLSKFLIGVPGYFRIGEEAAFPWHVDGSSVWYGLLVVEGGRICQYGFTSAAASKQAMCTAIEALDPTDDSLLLGVWTGSHRTDLFILSPTEALTYLKGAKRFARFEAVGEILEAELVQRDRSKYLSYAYRSKEGHIVHRSTNKRAEVADLLEYLSQRKIKVKERHES